MLILFTKPHPNLPNDPPVTLIQFDRNIKECEIKELEKQQKSCDLLGGDLPDLLNDIKSKMGIKYDVIRSGTMSEFPGHEYLVYEMIPAVI